MGRVHHRGRGVQAVQSGPALGDLQEDDHGPVVLGQHLGPDCGLCNVGPGVLQHEPVPRMQAIKPASLNIWSAPLVFWMAENSEINNIIRLGPGHQWGSIRIDRWKSWLRKRVPTRMILGGWDTRPTVVRCRRSARPRSRVGRVTCSIWGGASAQIVPGRSGVGGWWSKSSGRSSRESQCRHGAETGQDRPRL